MDIIRPYIKQYGGIFNDLTLGTRFMWGDEFGIEYAIIGDTLIMRETYSEHSSFYYPMGKDVESALAAIEEIAFNAGRLDHSIIINAEDFRRIVTAHEVHFLRQA